MRWILAWLLVSTIPSASGAALGEALYSRLAAGQPVTIAVLGDSVAQGMHLPDPDINSYAALLGRMLHERFGIQVTVTNLAVPGATTSDGLMLLREMRDGGPDLVILHFGGNDKGDGDGLDHLPAYEANLRQLIGACWAMGAACILVTPPMHEPVTDMPYPLAARRIGRELNVPVADIDTALKINGCDYRGIFPYFVHPREHGHAIMALEAYQAFCTLVGRPQTLTLTLPDTALDAKLGGVVPLPLRIERGLTQGELEIEATLGGMAVEVTGEGAERELTLGLPHMLPGARALEVPLWVRAAADDEVAFAIKRVACVPIIDCPRVGSIAARAPVAILGQANVTLHEPGTRSKGWTDERDLSAEVRLASDDETLIVRVDVRDQIVKPGSGAPYGDGIELYLDLRDDDQRGLPYYSNRVAVLFAPYDDTETAKVTTSTHDTPTLDPAAIEALMTRTFDGYRVELFVPRAMLDEAAGRRVTRLGIDIGVDDADAGQRDAQLMWLGRPDNYVNPRRFGELRLDEPEPQHAVRVTMF